MLRLIVAAAPDVTTMRLIGRLRDADVTLVADTCDTARRPLVLDLSELTSASEAGTLLLRRLASEGVHLLGSSSYMRLLLDLPTPSAPSRAGRRLRSPARPRAHGRGKRSERS